jgi:hypothetical protein
LIRRKQLDGDQNERISASITHYYNVIGEEEMEENRTWGRPAETQFREDPGSPASLLKNAAPRQRKKQKRL